MCTWFAVVVPLTDTFLDRYRSYGTDPKGKLRKVDLEFTNGNYSVLFSAGSALYDLACEKAQESQGQVIKVTGKYMFNNSDIQEPSTW